VGVVAGLIPRSIEERPGFPAVTIRPAYTAPRLGSVEPVPSCSSELSSPPASSTIIERYIHVSSTMTPPIVPYVLLYAANSVT
jgi:hypothetical protein